MPVQTPDDRWQVAVPAEGSEHAWREWADELPISRGLGLTCIKLEPGTGEFVVERPPIVANPNGSVHGGLLVAIADQCMGAVAMPTVPPGMAVTTASLSARYQRPAFAPLRLLATVTRLGQTLAFIEVNALDGQGRTCMSADGVMSVVSLDDLNRRTT